ncbi:hypothetical protein Tco_0180432 [Tanacetum coccineum]
MTANRISSDPDRIWVDKILRFTKPVGYGPTMLLLRHSDLFGQMTHFVASLTLDSAISCAMHGAFCTQRNVSMVSFGRISPNRFLSSILLVMVIIVTVVIGVVILVVVIFAIVGVVIAVVIFGVVVVVADGVSLIF